ncbi:MAG: hypothetical protein AUK47_00540 [Deltaproteobacteria bacterium CG2_30_63_29]|nr:MAG: hypothetical protein AUK47_00540 [Deltaproteobacteria bacterium CG2_30_63_29]PJB41799.1 MAG: hypothetical protein CO108_12605 [Deltaproteobacteria bacterium CG_4_9_14_3_um_filter_63_12]
MSKSRILIVEDNADTRELLCEQLADDLYELVTAEDGQDAILRVGEIAPDVVVMDVMMPHLDGFETSRYLKLRFQERFMPILLLTAKSDVESKEQGARYGCDDYRGKPYTRQQLLSSVELLLELGRHENALLPEPFQEGVISQAGQEQGAETSRVESIVAIRMQLAERMLSEQALGIARSHLDRVMELSPEHKGAKALFSQLDSGVEGK